jgi:type IV secretion system protein VirB6
MMDVCAAVPPSAGFISSMTGYIDCQSRTFGAGAWAALAAPGSTLTITLTGLLTIFIALIGYNLLLGRTLTIREGTLAFVKIGAIFALASSWPAYRTLVYDLVTDGPSQLVAEIGPRTGVVGTDGSLVERLDLADSAMAQLATLGPGVPPPNSGVQVPPPPFVGFDAFALGGSRILFELAAVGGLGIVKLIAGLMLALGPFFIAFLMFEGTRSLFEGWVRVLAGAALSSVGVSITLGLELALIEPWLSNVLARRMADEALPTVSTELFVIACLFSMLVAAALFGCVRVTAAFRMAPLLRLVPIETHQRNDVAASSVAIGHNASSSAGIAPSRAAVIADIMTAGNRERREALQLASNGPADSQTVPDLKPSVGAGQVPIPVGRSFTRRSHARVSQIANRRDASA